MTSFVYVPVFLNFANESLRVTAFEGIHTATPPGKLVPAVPSWTRTTFETAPKNVKITGCRALVGAF